MDKPPVIRNLDAVLRDVRIELRDALFVLADTAKDPAVRLARTETKIRNAIELLTGSRE